MKAVVFYEPSSASMEALVAVFPRHKAVADAYAARHDLLAIGTFGGAREGAMAVFKTRAAAEAFVAEDPFVREGLVPEYTIKDWDESLLG